MNILNIVIGETAIDIYSLIITVLSVVSGGGWFINYKMKKRAEKANAEMSEVHVKIDTFDYYVKRMDYLETKLHEVQSENANLLERLKKLEDRK